TYNSRLNRTAVPPQRSASLHNEPRSFRQRVNAQYARYDSRMRIGLFGGSFDPPHRGHIAVAEAVRDKFALDRLLLAPTAIQPLKHGAHASFIDRLRMVELL